MKCPPSPEFEQAILVISSFKNDNKPDIKHLLLFLLFVITNRKSDQEIKEAGGERAAFTPLEYIRESDKKNQTQGSVAKRIIILRSLFLTGSIETKNNLCLYL